MRDDANMLVIEAVLLGVIVAGALYYVLGYEAPISDTAVARSDIDVAAGDALRILVGLRACDGLEGAEFTRCDDVYGTVLAKRLATEALTGDPGNLSLKMKSLVPTGARWNLWLSNGVEPMPLVHSGLTPPGEASTATMNVAPEWNHTVVVADRSRYGGSGGAGNPMVVEALPVWKSYATRLTATDGLEARYSNGAKVHLMNATIDGARGNASTVAWWNFNEGTGTLATNASREPTAALTLDLPTRWVEGRRGPAVAFSAVHPTLVASHAGLRAPAVSMLVWARASALPALNDVRLIEYAPDAAGAERVAIQLGTDGKPYAIWTDGTTTRTARAIAAMPTGAWTHLAATYGDGALTLYVDGVLAASQSASGGFGLSATPAARLGGKLDVGHVEAFSGRLDEVRVYSRVLAEDEFSLARSGYSTTWPAAAAPTGLGSRVTRSGEVLTGSTVYRAGGAATQTLARDLMYGTNNSTVSAGAADTWSRAVPLEGVAVVEYDFRPVLRALKAAGATIGNVAPGVETRTTISVRSPVTQPPGSNERHHELANLTLDGAHGTALVPVPRTALLGSHAVVASLSLTFTHGGTTESLLVRKVDYVDVVNPDVGPASPIYRLVAELWLPEWN